MKLFFIPILDFFLKEKIKNQNCFLFFLLFSFQTFVAQTSCPTAPVSPTYTNDSFTGNLNSGETVLFTNGYTYTGNVNSLPSGAVIYVSDGAIFTPSSFNNPQGTVQNCGTTNFGGINLNAGVVIENYGTMNFISSLNINGAITLINGVDANMEFTNSFTLSSSGSNFTNYGNVIANQELATDNNTIFTNNGYVQSIGGNFNPNGTVINNGKLYSMQFININSNSVLTNNCNLTADKGFNNNSSNTVNNGYIIVTGIDGYPNDLFQNNQTYTQGVGAVVSGVRFSNLSTINGAGSYYFTGETINQGNFGNDGQGINFYDSTNTDTSPFDTTNVIPDSSVTSTSFTPPTSTSYDAANCSTIVSPISTDSSTDTDNDGIPDLTDIDDDNDGITDFIESPNCFYSEEEVAAFTELNTTTDFVFHSTRSYDLMFDESFSTSTSSWAQLAANTAVSGLSLVELNTNATHLIVDKVRIYTNTQYPASVTFQLEGSNNGGTNWERLSDPQALNVTNSSFDFNNTVNTGASYSSYRIAGVAGTATATGRIVEIIFYPLDYNPNLNPKDTCTDDSDSDTVYNHLDLDSDQDNCSDALEAGATTDKTANYKFTNTVTNGEDTNANGLADALEDTSTFTGLNYIPTYKYANNAFYDVCLDSDLDGIKDIVDLDDDNDGILDTEECPATSLNITSDSKMTVRYWKGISEELLLHSIVPITEGGILLDIDEYGLPIQQGTPDADLVCDAVIGHTTFRCVSEDPAHHLEVVVADFWIQFPSTLYGTTIKVRVSNALDNGRSPVGSGAWVISSDCDPNNWIDPTYNIAEDSSPKGIDYGPLLDMNNTTNFVSSQYGGATPPFGYENWTASAITTIGTGYERGEPSAYEAEIVVSEAGHFGRQYVVDQWISAGFSGFQYSADGGATWSNIEKSWYSSKETCMIPSADASTECDDDGDGIPNRLDLDSDQDECSDAYESGATTDTTTDYAFSTSITNGDLNANGLADVVEDSTLPGTVNYTSTYNTIAKDGISSCPEDTDGDGVPDYIDLDNDNDGIFDTEEENCLPNDSRLDFDITGDVLDPDGQTYGTTQGIDVTINYTENDSGTLTKGLTTSDRITFNNNYNNLTTSNELSILFSIDLTSGAYLELTDLDQSGDLDFSEQFEITFYKDGVKVAYIADLGANLLKDGNVFTAITGGATDDDPASTLRVNVTANIDQIIIKSSVVGNSTDTDPDTLGANIRVHSCYQDTDNDGIEDKFDTDSDGDRCNDAIESGHIDSDGDGEVDGTGYETTNGTVTGASTSYTGTTTDVTLVGPDADNDGVSDSCDDIFDDHDGDGVADFYDLDDDNDGVLDTDEGCSSNLILKNIQNTPPVGAWEVFVYDGHFEITNASNATDVFSHGPDGTSGEAPVLSAHGYYTGSATSYTFNEETISSYTDPTTSVIASGVELVVLEPFTTSNSGNWSLVYKRTIENTGTVTIPAGSYLDDWAEIYVNDILVAYNTSFLESSPNALTANVVAGDKVEIRLTNGLSQGGFNLTIETNSETTLNTICGILDTDGDGVPNYLDLDSDGDGCPDTIESNIPLTNIDLQLADIQNGDGTTNTTTSALNAILDIEGIDANNDGLNDSVDAAQDGTPDYVSTYATFALVDTENTCTIDLSLIKTVDKPIVKLGAEIIFTITLKNTSVYPATEVQVKDILPTGLQYSATGSTIPNNTTYTPSTGIWDLSSMSIGNGDTIQLKIGATVTTAGAIILNQAEIFTYKQTDKDSTANSNN
ncbi:DUF11 domain-containing protein [uncultured Polaribacter sp.]|uniref:DUF11 domain-containing protein n=1 Tax=uncultured Polaribacter sp. TaxID=174711 RepID=UPI00260F5895|nr:DUF11 domain-containing protein [uncultured Polaribacter sp.]